MKRDPKLLQSRIKRVGLFFELKKDQGLPSKVAIIEIAEMLSIGVHTVNNDLAQFNKEWRVV